jgi:hypothetical protein
MPGLYNEFKTCSISLNHTSGLDYGQGVTRIPEILEVAGLKYGELNPRAVVKAMQLISIGFLVSIRLKSSVHFTLFSYSIYL